MSTRQRPLSRLRRWVRDHPPVRSLLRLPGRMTDPFRRQKFLSGLAAYAQFFRDLGRFKGMGGTAPVIDLYPILHERTPGHGIDSHYFYQAVWAIRKIVSTNPREHVDVGSQALYVGMLTAVVPVRFIDLRPLDGKIPNLSNEEGTILDLPIQDQSVYSLSCLHVIEHIGLGRYGDPIDPKGPKKAAAELSRVIAPGGSLYLSLPVGRPSVQFNAHRVIPPETVIDMFGDLELVEFSLVDDDGSLKMNVAPNVATAENFACGLFHFRHME